MDFRQGPPKRFAAIANLSPERAEREAKALRRGIRYHDRLYYVESRPRISDAAYDRLFRRLKELEDAFPELRTRDSPTVRVGARPASRLRRVRHSNRMLSLEAVRSGEAVAGFHERVRAAARDRTVTFALEPKFDGVSVELVYESGRLERAVTRGDGTVGDDVTHTVRTVDAVPLVLKAPARAPARLAVRGEIFMPRSGFQAVNRGRLERGEEPFANPRNAAAGTVRQLDPGFTGDAPLEAFVYEILAISGDRPRSHRAALDRLKDLGLPVCRENGRTTTVAGMRRYHAKLAARRDDLDYEIDGIVVKVDELELRARLGERSRSPRWAIAWKFAPRAESTLVEDIAVQVGRTGVLTPVALLKPVDVGGVTVSRATLHNEADVRRKDVRVGDTVRVLRAGDVIPEIGARLPQPGRRRRAPFRMPRRCPACGAAIVRDGAQHRCPAGLACPAQLAGRIRHFASRAALDIAGLGEITVSQLVSAGLVEDVADLYGLSVGDLASLDGLAEKSARKLHEAIQGHRRPPLDRFVYALGIPNVGRRTARLLAQEFGSLAALTKADPERIAAIDGVGDRVAGSVTGFFGEERNRDVLDRLQRAGLRVLSVRRPAGRLDGKTFVLTGRLSGYTRAEATDRIESLGGRMASRVSGQTDCVVAGRNPGSKLTRARAENVQVLDERAFASLIGDAD